MPVWGLEFALSASDPASARARSKAESNITLLVEYLRSIQKAK
jgi:hypothetical protein